ncbi:MAG: lipopolysaccharide heptosyltransferase II [Cytophagales bacterium]|nr:lipopolysaccharide heptosyltransferase II [Armatimonadota bacterium]
MNLNYLGDALFTTPALASLRARYPDASIEVLAGERAAAILAGNPNIDRVLVRPRRSGSARASAFARTIRTGRYDAAVLFQSIASNAALAWLLGVPIRVGFAQDGCTPFLTHRVAERRAGEHVVEAYLRLADAVPEATDSGKSAPPPLSIAISTEDRAFADHVFRHHELMPPVVGLVIGATRPQKRWPEEYWARLAEKLWSTQSVSCVLLGGPEEVEAAQRVMALAPNTPLSSLVGKTSEKQLAALVDRLGLVISGDSGPLHIATAMATPVVALFGSTDPAETGPWQGGSAAARSPCAPAVVLYDALACAPCRKNPTCGGRFDCLKSFTPERVFESACDLLALPLRRTALPMIAASAPRTPAVAVSGGSPRRISEGGSR